MHPTMLELALKLPWAVFSVALLLTLLASVPKPNLNILSL